MGRAILAVIVGYIVMAAMVFGLFTGAYLLLGADGAFKPNSWEVSTTWLAASFVLGLIAAVMGGLVCSAIARRTGPVLGLIIVVLVLGAVSALMQLSKEAPQGDRPSTLSNFEAMTHARMPMSSAILNPLIGAAGVFLGGRMVKPKAAAAPAA